MKLKHELVTYFEVDYSDFEQFVNDHYPFKTAKDRDGYSFVAIEEGSNDSEYTFEVDPEDYLQSYSNTKYDKEKLTKIRNGNIGTFENHYLFRILYEDGLIEPGNYLITVSW